MLAAANASLGAPLRAAPGLPLPPLSPPRPGGPTASDAWSRCRPGEPPGAGAGAGSAARDGRRAAAPHAVLKVLLGARDPIALLRHGFPLPAPAGGGAPPAGPTPLQIARERGHADAARALEEECPEAGLCDQVGGGAADAGRGVSGGPRAEGFGAEASRAGRGRPDGGGGERAAGKPPPPPPPTPRTKWTHRVPHPVLIGHAASSPRTNRTRRVPHPRTNRTRRVPRQARAHRGPPEPRHPAGTRGCRIQLSAGGRRAAGRATRGRPPRRGSTGCRATNSTRSGAPRPALPPPPPPSLPYKVDTSRPSLRTNWTRLAHRGLRPPAAHAARRGPLRAFVCRARLRFYLKPPPRGSLRRGTCFRRTSRREFSRALAQQHTPACPSMEQVATPPACAAGCAPPPPLPY